MRRAPFLALAALLSACVSAPSTKPIETPLKAETLGLDGASTPAIADKWWTAFDDPELDTLVERALSSSPTLAVALARTRSEDQI